MSRIISPKEAGEWANKVWPECVKQAFAVPVQEPVSCPHGMVDTCCENYSECALSATPPAAQRQWLGLTDKAITKVIDSMPRGIKGWMSDWDLYDYARAIEAKLKEKNT